MKDAERLRVAFGSYNKVADALGVQRGTVYRWRDNDAVPPQYMAYAKELILNKYFKKETN